MAGLHTARMNRPVVCMLLGVLLLIFLFLLYKSDQPTTSEIRIQPPEQRTTLSVKAQSQKPQKPEKPQKPLRSQRAPMIIHPLNDSNIHPQASYGCHHNETTIDGLKFRCNPPVPLTQEMSVTKRRDAYYKLMRQVDVDCKHTELLGRPDDGGWRLCTEGPFKWTKDNCLVYSFGIRDDWSFDEAAADKYHCDVLSFDPSIGQEDHKHAERVMFYNTGLGGEDVAENELGWKMRTLCTLISELEHRDKVIDYVKFDIEFSEWPALLAMVSGGCLSQVKQMAFEVHSWEDTAEYYMVFWQALQGLQNAGFECWRARTQGGRCFKPKDNNKKRYCPQADMNFINTKFLEGYKA